MIWGFSQRRYLWPPPNWRGPKREGATGKRLPQFQVLLSPLTSKAPPQRNGGITLAFWEPKGRAAPLAGWGVGQPLPLASLLSARCAPSSWR